MKTKRKAIVMGKFEEAVELLKKAEFIYICGDGGSAALADHLACDLLKNAGLKAISLCSNGALITAIGNDVSFEAIYMEQLKALMTPYDLLIALSTSGQSPNLIMAAVKAQDIKAKVISITGHARGNLAEFATVSLVVGGSDMQEIEDNMAICCHKLYKTMVER